MINQKNIQKDMQKEKFDVSFIDFFNLLTTDEHFRDLICDIFKNCKYNNVYWEFPGLNKNNANSKAEFVLINTGQFSKSDHSAFSEYFPPTVQTKVISFKNLSKDCDLITVTPTSNNKNFYNSCSDIMTFFKSSYVPKELHHQLLINIGTQMSNYLKGTQKKYLSTSGRGVPWLHVRICNTHKYYNHIEYFELT